MEKPKLVITEAKDFNRDVILKLNQFYNVSCLNVENEKELIVVLENVEVAFVRLKFVFSEAILNRLPKLKFILSATTGEDHVDKKALEDRGGQLVSLKDEVEFLESIPSTAEHTWGLLLAIIRHLPQAYNDVNIGFWRRDLFKGNNIRGKRLGILGLGRVGRQVANFGIAFGMDVGYYDINRKVKSTVNCFNSAEALFSWADIISIHIPLSEPNRGFVSTNLLDKLAPHCIIINTSRGAVVKEHDLVTFIKNKSIAGYATDVLEDEWGDILNNPIVQLSKEGYNVIVTPHISGCTYESMHDTEAFVTEKFLSVNNHQKQFRDL